MFIYFVAPVATLLIIFGLLHAKRLDDWLRSSIRCSLTLYNGLTCRRLAAVAASPTRASSASLLNTEQEEEEENSILRENTGSPSERSGAEDISARHRTTFDPRRKERSLNGPRYSFEDLLSEERDEDLGLPSAGGIALGKIRLGASTIKDDDAVRTVEQEAKENIFESLRNYPTSRSNARQIYNMIMKETLKESEARRQLLDTDRTKFDESSLPPIEIKEHIPSSSSSSAAAAGNRVVREDDIDE